MEMEPSDPDPVRLLLIEDDDALAQLMQEYLHIHRLEVLRVTSGDAGVEAIIDTQPHREADPRMGRAPTTLSPDVAVQ